MVRSWDMMARATRLGKGKLQREHSEWRESAPGAGTGKGPSRTARAGRAPGASARRGQQVEKTRRRENRASNGGDSWNEACRGCGKASRIEDVTCSRNRGSRTEDALAPGALLQNFERTIDGRWKRSDCNLATEARLILLKHLCHLQYQQETNENDQGWRKDMDRSDRTRNGKLLGLSRLKHKNTHRPQEYCI